MQALARYLYLILFVSTVSSAQRMPPGQIIGIDTTYAKKQVDSLARVTLKTQKEQIACVTHWIMADTAFIILKIGPAQIDSTTDVYVFAHQPMCRWWQPTIHTHWVHNEYFYDASPIDQHTSALRDIFGFLVSVESDSTWKFKAYP